MGFYGTLKLIFFKVSIDYWIDPLIGAAVVRLVRDDEAFLPRIPLRRVRVREALRMSPDQVIDYRSADGGTEKEFRIKAKDFLLIFSNMTYQHRHQQDPAFLSH